MEGRGGSGGGQHQSQRKPRRGRGSYGRARGQGASPASPSSPSTTVVTPPQQDSPDTPVPVVSEKVEPVRAVQLESPSEQLPSSHEDIQPQQPQQTEEKAPKDPVIIGPSHQFEKSVRIRDPPAVKIDEKVEEQQEKIVSPTAEAPAETVVSIEKEAETKSGVEESAPVTPIQETPKIEKAKEEYQPRVLVVEPEPPRQRKQSDKTIHDPPKEVELPIAPLEKSTEKEKRPRSRSSAPRTSLSYSYALGGPVGKPGYIPVATADGDDPWDDGKGRRISKIAEVKSTVMGFSSRQWVTLFVFGMADLLSATLYSIQAPFYPAEAERKGATATEYGLVFGVFELVVFIMSPIYGKYINKIGPKLVYNLGVFTTGTACILFGLLDKLNDHTLFITFSFIIRICEAIGNAAFMTASFTIIAYEFPENVATTFASLETFFGLGLILGPTIGGVLYQVGGFILPFAVTGTAILIMAVLAAIVMPKIELQINEDGKSCEGFGILSILKIPGVALAAVSIMMGANSIGFLSATLEPHLRQFALTPVQTGLVFIINGGVYALTAPVFGLITDKVSQPKYVMLMGAIFAIVSFLLIGPAPFLPIESTLWMTSVGLLVHGLALGAILVSGFILALRDWFASTYGVVSGLWTSMLSLGAFIGPSIGGVLLDNVGFQLGSLYILIGESVVVVLVIFFILMADKPSSKKDDIEAQPLLSSSPKPGTSKETQLKLSYGTTGESDA